MEAPDFWDDAKKSQQVIQNLKQLKSSIEGMKKLEEMYEDEVLEQKKPKQYITLQDGYHIVRKKTGGTQNVQMVKGKTEYPFQY